MARTYETAGSVRGHCGHKHMSIKTAWRCYQSDSAGCKSQGGYSDRWQLIAKEDGQPSELTEDERRLWSYSSEAFDN